MHLNSSLLKSGKWFAILALLTFLPALLPSQDARGQGLELGGGWAHGTANFGTDGFNVGVAYWFTRRITLAADYDSTWDSSTLNTFTFTQTGPIAVKSRLQNFLLGPRIFVSTNWTDKHKLDPFAEAEFGGSHLSQTVTQGNVGSVSQSDSAFSWMLGGGAEYAFHEHWGARMNLDFLRTHFASQGQSQLRLVIALTYTFGER